MIDSLTGLPNLVGFLDWINGFPQKNLPFPFSLMAIHLTPLWQVNRNQGRPAGDELFKWCAEMLKTHHSDPVFRAGGDKFVLLFGEPDLSQNLNRVQQVAKRLNAAERLLPFGKVRISVIHFVNDEEVSPGNILACVFVSLADRYHETCRGQPVEFLAESIRAMKEYPWMMVDLADQFMRLGYTTDKYRHLAETDSVSQLPNLLAGMNALEIAIANSQLQNEPLAVLLIDGDNLRQYNKVSFAAGDQAIQLLGATIKGQVRDTDFLARYRAGDEFLLLLPGTSLEKAIHIGQRLCWAVERASKAWLFPTTISIGVALCPADGQTGLKLLKNAELGLALSKKEGKNQVRAIIAPVPCYD